MKIIVGELSASMLGKTVTFPDYSGKFDSIKVRAGGGFVVAVKDAGLTYEVSCNVDDEVLVDDSVTVTLTGQDLECIKSWLRRYTGVDEIEELNKGDRWRGSAQVAKKLGIL